MREGREGFKLNGIIEFDHYNASVFVQPRPRSQHRTPDFHFCCQSPERLCVPEQVRDRGLWGGGEGEASGVRQLSIPKRRVSDTKGAPGVPGARATASDPTVHPHPRDTLGEPQVRSLENPSASEENLPLLLGSAGELRAAP